MASTALKLPRVQPATGALPGRPGHRAAVSRSRGPLAVEMLDGRFVAPDDLFACQSEDRGNAVALVGARRPSAQHDRLDAWLVQAGQFGELPGAEPALGAELIEASGIVVGHRTILQDTVSDAASLWAPAKLRAMAIDVIDRCRASPKDLFGTEAQGV